uniref:SDR family NAD(P)-dependent oxidoreductase n=1 Tax=Parerythrobacter lutipelagi TaxID=1964208 RepID=UPI0010F559D2|nr:SDR family NAD(P)-dependent oxidoreductase [Parerythrobacter lutipelagi]
MRFSGKTVVITGAASGIGEAAAKLFANEGATVYAADIDEAGGQALAESSDGSIRFQRCDVTSCEDIRALMDRAGEETGGIDVLFNNAGAGGARPPIHEIEPDEWDLTMDLLLRSVAMGIRYAVPHMQHRHGASIVNVSSISAVGPGYAPTAYSVAKAAVLHLTKMAAADLAQFGIRVNVLQPGFINTNIFTSALEIPDELVPTVKNAISQIASDAQPVKRSGQPEDIAQACAYLASEAGSFVNGTSLIIDGGMTIGPRYSWDPDEPDMFESLRAMEEAAKKGASE